MKDSILSLDYVAKAEKGDLVQLDYNIDSVKARPV